MSILNTAISGLQAASIDLQVSGNNVANSSTYGFKQGRTEFADLFYAGRQGLQVGNGVQVSAINQDFGSIGYTVTGGTFDFAANGDGFFIARSPSSNATHYTRAGNFKMDQNGKLVTQGGEVVQGYQASNNYITASLGDLTIPFNQVTPPKETNNVEFDLNLSASDEVVSAPFNPADNTTFNSRTSISVYDSLGTSHILDTYYIKTAENTWSVEANIDGSSIGNGSLIFDNDGNLTSANGLSNLAFNPTNGAQIGQKISLSYGNTTQYGSPTSVLGLSADGCTTGMPGGVNVDSNGIIQISYSNGQSLVVGQLALAKFTNPHGLEAVGNTAWLSTSASGNALVSPDNSNSAIRSGTLENSNVDLTEQLVKLISAQRSYQANAQSIRAGDAVLQTIINIG